MLNLKRVAGLEMAHLPEITAAFAQLRSFNAHSLPF
jgi:hypothetical protein